MTREQNQLIKKIRNLSSDDVGRVLQFLQQLNSPEFRAVPPELKAVGGEQQHEAALFESAPAIVPSVEPMIGLEGSEPAPSVKEAMRREPAREPSSPEAEIAHAACAQWRRRPFQAIDADDLQPIAALFREAVDSRAASRFRYGSR
jgi:hypothetical protein